MSNTAICPICKRVFRNGGGGARCQDCKSELEEIFVGGWREGLLGEIVEEYKYSAIWALGDVLVGVLDASIPRADDRVWEGFGDKDIVIVPLPTIGRHVRERGLDHTLRVARKLARLRGWRCERMLSRAVDTVQVGSKEAKRQEQAKKAYEAKGKIDAGKMYILLDDVWTTGASMLAAAKVMRDAGVEHMMGALIAVGKPRETEEVR